MTTVATERLIKPHGGSLVERTGDRPEGVDGLERVRLTSREVSDLDMVAAGALSPLEGFMCRADYARVAEEMRLANGLVWALPVCLAVPAAPSGDRVALADEAGNLLAVLDVDEVYEYDRTREAERCFRTTDEAHPGVARLYAQHPLYLAGRVLVLVLQRVRGGVGVAWRYGIANVARRGRESSVQVVAFGIGLMVLLLLTSVRTELMTEWQATLPTGAPNHFLINIQPAEREALGAALVAAGVPEPMFTPLVRARISHVNGVPAADYPALTPRGRAELEDETNLTWSAALPAANISASGMDVRDQARGIDRGSYPSNRVFTIGFGLVF